MFRPPTLRPSHAIPRLCPRPFSTTTPSSSALFNLNGLAHSRESQYLSKERGIPRTEYSSNIHLIRSSEVDPFPNAPGASKDANESRIPSRKRTGRHATIAATPEADGTLVRRLMDDTHPAQQREGIQELLVQLRAAREEITHLRATIHGLSVGTHDAQNAPRDSYRSTHSLLTWAGGLTLLALCIWAWDGLPRNTMNERARRQDVQAKEGPASQKVVTEEPKQKLAIPGFVDLASSEPQHTQRGHKSRGTLSFLWA